MRDTTILIRFDDICPTMNWSEWKRAITILDRYNVKPLIGVIPQCQDNELMIDEARNDFWNYIKELQCKGYTVAMHGFLHKYDTNTHGIVNITPHSEFAGHTYEEVVERTGASTATISRVKRCLNYGADGYDTVLNRLK